MPARQWVISAVMNGLSWVGHVRLLNFWPTRSLPYYRLNTNALTRIPHITMI
jgi:hypothetical protein